MWMDTMDDLRYEPTPKRLRATLDGEPVLDTTRGILVWEPGRVVPTYAVPSSDIAKGVELVPTATVAPAKDIPMSSMVPGGPRVIEHAPFSSHSTEGQSLTVRCGSKEQVDAAFRPADPKLSSFVVFDFDALEWREEEQRIVGHPRDPFHRVDVLPSSRHVKVELHGVILAESQSPMMLFETKLPPRVYIPRSDIRFEHLAASEQKTICAYKGHATYFSATVGAETIADVAWVYEAPFPEARAIAGMLSFYPGKVEITLDGKRLR